MKRSMRIPLGLVTLSVVLWAALFYLTYVLPHQVAAWEEAGRTMPRLLAALVNLGRMLQAYGLGVALAVVLSLLTVGSLVRLITALGRAETSVVSRQP